MFHWLIDGQSACMVYDAANLFPSLSCHGTEKRCLEDMLIFSKVYPGHVVTLHEGNCPMIEGELATKDGKHVLDLHADNAQSEAVAETVLRRKTAEIKDSERRAEKLARKDQEDQEWQTFLAQV